MKLPESPSPKAPTNAPRPKSDTRTTLPAQTTYAELQRASQNDHPTSDPSVTLRAQMTYAEMERASRFNDPPTREMVISVHELIAWEEGEDRPAKQEAPRERLPTLCGFVRKASGRS